MIGQKLAGDDRGSKWVDEGQAAEVDILKHAKISLGRNIPHSIF